MSKNNIKKRINDRRNRINKSILEEKIKPFSRYKVLTYLSMFIFTPYGIYRIWAKDSEFNYGEKLFYSFVSLMYLSSIIKLVFKL